MDKLRIAWNRRALNHFDRIAEWYAFNMGKQAAAKFAKGVQNTLHTLAHSPQIGFVDEFRSTEKTTITVSSLTPNIALYIDILIRNW